MTSSFSESGSYAEIGPQILKVCLNVNSILFILLIKTSIAVVFFRACLYAAVCPNLFICLFLASSALSSAMA